MKKSCPEYMRVSIPTVLAFPTSSSFGSRVAVLLNRFVGTERFLRRPGERRALRPTCLSKTVAFLNREGGLTSQSCLVPLWRAVLGNEPDPDADAVA